MSTELIKKINVNGKVYELAGSGYSNKLYYIPLISYDGTTFHMRSVLIDSENNIIKDSGIFTATDLSDYYNFSDGGDGYLSVLAEVFKVLNKKNVNVIFYGSDFNLSSSAFGCESLDAVENIPSVAGFPGAFLESGNYNPANDYVTRLTNLDFVFTYYEGVQLKNSNGTMILQETLVTSFDSGYISDMISRGFLTKDDLGFEIDNTGPTAL